MTGALSPVITDSSIVAMPSMTSPSPGIRSPAWQITMSPDLRLPAGICSIPKPRMRLATASDFVLRSASAWAFPRASAIASAKLANRTVNQSQRAIWNSNPRPVAPAVRSRTRKMVTRRAPTSTTKITGFLTSACGLSLRNESRIARLNISLSNRGRERLNLDGISEAGFGDRCCTGSGVGVWMVVDIILAPERNLQEGHQFALVHQEVLDDRAKGQCGEECKSTDQND